MTTWNLGHKCSHVPPSTGTNTSTRDMDLDLASVQRSRHFQPNGLSAAHDAAMSRSTNQLTQLKPHAGVSCATAQQVGLWLIVPCLSPHYQIPHRNDCQTSLNQVVLDRLPLLSLPYVNMPSRYFLMAGINPGNLRDYSPSHTIKKNMPCQVRNITIPPDRQLCLVVPG